MSYPNSVFSSVEGEKRWVLAMDKNFPQQHTGGVVAHFLDPPPPCVFRVPKSLSETKPEAYAPQHIGLGPYHHLRPELYKMQHYKLAAITRFLGPDPETLPDIRTAVDALVQCEPLLRACYDHYLDLDIQTLAWVLAIDALYLLQLLTITPSHPAAEIDDKLANDILMLENQIPFVLLTKIQHPAAEIDDKLANDILMLENQIPFVLLKKIQQVLQLSLQGPNFLSFCRDHSPLGLNEHLVIENPPIGQAHLLHWMYHLMMNNTQTLGGQHFTTFSAGLTRISLDNVGEGMQFLADRGLPGAGAAGQLISFLKNVPWGKIFGLFKKEEGPEDEQTPVKEIDIPSVSQMSVVAGIKFVLITPGGIRDIKFDDKSLYLPRIRLNGTSEVVLRNLMAFEAASAEPGSTLELAEYVDLMCGIVDDPKDVVILRKEGIIESQLGDEEIARIFNGISKSMGEDEKNRSNITDAVDSVNKGYENLGRVKVKRFVVKYGYGLLKIMSVLITVAVLVLLVLQAFCSVFGCGRWFGKMTAQSGDILLSDH